MNKKDAAVYKALAECGFDYGNEIPDPDADEVLHLITNPDEKFLHDVESLFCEDNHKPTNSWVDRS